MMNRSSLSSQVIVVDANIAVWAVVPTLAEIPTLDRLQQWHHQRREILAPDLWIAEAVSVIRLLISRKLISSDKRLVNGARQRGFSQIAWIGEDDTEERVEEHQEEQDDLGTKS